jgi:hypothetical protein
MASTSLEKASAMIFDTSIQVCFILNLLSSLPCIAWLGSAMFRILIHSPVVVLCLLKTVTEATSSTWLLDLAIVNFVSLEQTVDQSSCGIL